MENFECDSLWDDRKNPQQPTPPPKRGIQAFMLRRVAVHEMCHGYCAHLLGVPLSFVTIVPKDDQLGDVQLTKRASAFNPAHLTPAQSNDWVRKHCIIGFAGNAGILRLTGQSDWEGAAEDLDVIRSIIKLVATSDDDGEERFQKYWREAKFIVNRDWNLICRLSESLMEQKTLNNRQINYLIEQERRK